MGARGPRLRDGVTGGVGYQEVLDGHQDRSVRPPASGLGPGRALLFLLGDVVKELRQRLDGEKHGPDGDVLDLLAQPGDEGAVKQEPSMTASRPSPASFTATAATAGKTASAWPVNPAMMPPGVESPVTSQAVCETFASAGDSSAGTYNRWTSRR